ncbi:hypothetical protein CEUSTIGMA_g976.t1 [Chlamydomonas eustigma]|uniref:Inositol polyphosphate multikinase n=1 Tax=Chlamydomonas eustigma TaxID=1157962 RepID=A0A250WRQ0_9CHLO|nr:hypothetical protein CEUSTIGMA_g976.t1 [Chlamydomonas eustigma]|eukprot:GAX73524.1 hypothetical protein CEUSTIGMA_g976.t1 [Chlamydomonas eustigma]
MNRIPISSSLGALHETAGGHSKALLTSPQHDGCVLKILSNSEYNTIKYLQDTSLREFCPELHGVTQIDGMDYMVVQNLLHGMKEPKVMDIKMGTRTFELSEVDKPEKRKDLLEKMIALDPTAPSDEERLEGVTKLRYMQYREQCSTTASLGFRMEGITSSSCHTDDSSRSLCKEAARLIRDRDGALAAISGYFEGDWGLINFFRLKLIELQSRLHESEWFAGHELIGTSLLFVYDQSPDHQQSCAIGTSGLEEVSLRMETRPIVGSVWMIDFVHTHPAREQPLTHEVQWKEGSQEDGYLIGLTSLISLLQDLLKKTSPPVQEAGTS